jgi:hypothetical protein
MEFGSITELLMVRVLGVLLVGVEEVAEAQ